MSRSNQIAGLITATPTATLDTINEINTSLNNDANLSTTLTNSIATKMPLAGGTFTGDVTFSSPRKVGIGTSTLDANILTGVTSGSNSANIYLGATGTGNAELVLDASNGDFAGSDYYMLRQLNDLNVENWLGTSGDYIWKTAAGTERLRITSSGNVGIGTGFSPSKKLHLYNATGGTDLLRLEVADSDSAFIVFKNSDREWRMGEHSQEKFEIYDTTASETRLLIDTSGNVGIGLTSGLGAKLHVYDDRDITNNADTKGLRLDESSGKWLLSLGQSGTSNTSFGIRDVTNSKYPIIIQGQTHAGSAPAINIYNDGRVDFDKAIFAEALRTLYLGRNTTLNINPYTQLGQYGQGGVFYVSFGSWPGNAGLFQVRWHNAGGNGGITYSSYDVIVRSSTALGLTVSHTQNNSIYDSVIHVTSVGHHSNSHGWAGGVVNFCRYDS